MFFSGLKTKATENEDNTKVSHTAAEITGQDPSDELEGIRTTRKIYRDKHAINRLLKGNGIYVDPAEIEKFDVSKRINKSAEFS